MLMLAAQVRQMLAAHHTNASFFFVLITGYINQKQGYNRFEQFLFDLEGKTHSTHTQKKISKLA
jgi:hypothetical protein